MRGRIQNVWDNISSSLWFIPSLFVIVAFAVSSLAIEADVLLTARESTVVPWLFSGTADAARTLLSVVAGSLITVISIAISLTMVALVQASAQFTPRLLRQFIASRTNQIVLGVYTGTFIYALLILRTVRSGDESSTFVPALSVTLSVALALVCLGFLIYFIHHMSQSLQVAVILDTVRQDLLEAVDAFAPKEPADVPADHVPATLYIQQAENSKTKDHVRSIDAGFIRRIDTEILREASFNDAKVIIVHPKVGEFVSHGTALATIDTSANDEIDDVVRSAFVLDRERTTRQDPLFAVRQLVDIALKALSPGINDPTTAEYALFHLNDALGQLANRTFPLNHLMTEDQQTHIILAQPNWEDFVQSAFSQICEAANTDAHVTMTILDVFYDLAERIPPNVSARPIQKLVTEIRFNINQHSYSPVVAAELHKLADRVEKAIAER